MRRLYLAACSLLFLTGVQAYAQDPQVSAPGQHFEQREGEHLFKAICQGCHMAQGQGGMPGFKSQLDDEQIAAVVTYIRTHNGNTFNQPVDMATVKALTGR